MTSMVRSLTSSSALRSCSDHCLISSVGFFPAKYESMAVVTDFSESSAIWERRSPILSSPMSISLAKEISFSFLKRKFSFLPEFARDVTLGQFFLWIFEHYLCFVEFNQLS